MSYARVASSDVRLMLTDVQHAKDGRRKKGKKKERKNKENKGSTGGRSMVGDGGSGAARS